MVDDEDVRATVHQFAEIPNTATLDDLQSTLGDFLTAIDLISDGIFKRCEAAIVVKPEDLSLLTTKTGSEEVSETGEFQYTLTGVDTVWTLAVPAISEAVISGNNIDILNSHIIALNTLLTSSLFTSGFFSSPDRLELDTRRATFLGTRKHRKQQHAKSYKLG
jgi:hypothetical protein